MKRSLFHIRPRWYVSRASKAVSYVRHTTEELTGQNDVSLAQRQVKETRNELKTWRKRVADATTSYEEVQHKLRHVYAMKTQLYQAQRRDVIALQAINSEEESLLSEEQALAEALESLNEEERQCFDALGDSILNSHEKERAQSEKMKYYSRLASILGAVVGFAGSNMFLRKEVRRHQKLQEEKMNNLEEVLNQFTLQQHTHNQVDGISEVLDGFGKSLRQSLQEKSDKQLMILEQDMSAYRASSDGESFIISEQSTILVVGLGLFVLSYALCGITMTFSRIYY